MSELADEFDYQSSNEDCCDITDFSLCKDRTRRPRRIQNRGTAWTFSDTWEFNVQAISATSFQQRKKKAQDEIKRCVLVLLNANNGLMEKIRFVTIVMDCESLEYGFDDELYKVPYRCYVQSIQIYMNFLQDNIGLQVEWTSIPGGLNESEQFQKDHEPNGESSWERIVIYGEMKNKCIRKKSVSFSMIL